MIYHFSSRTIKQIGEEMIYWWELRFMNCGLDISFDEIMSKDFKTKKARDNNWNKFAELNGWNNV